MDQSPYLKFNIQKNQMDGIGDGCHKVLRVISQCIHHGIRGYSGPVYSSGWSFNVPTQDLVDAFDAGDKRKNASVLDIVAWADANGAHMLRVMSIQDTLIISIYQELVIQKIPQKLNYENNYQIYKIC